MMPKLFPTSRETAIIVSLAELCEVLNVEIVLDEESGAVAIYDRETLRYIDMFTACDQDGLSLDTRLIKQGAVPTEFIPD